MSAEGAAHSNKAAVRVAQEICKATKQPSRRKRRRSAANQVVLYFEKPHATGNRHPPFTMPPTERVLQVSPNIAAQLSVAEILPFDCDSQTLAFYRRGRARLMAVPR